MKVRSQLMLHTRLRCVELFRSIHTSVHKLLHLATTASPTLLETPTALGSIISLEFSCVTFLVLLHDDLLWAC